MVEALLNRVCYPLLLISGIGLHAYTVWTGFHLATAGVTQYVAALAAYAFPLISELALVYFAWRASGSWVNGYSVWVLLWVALAVGVWILAASRGLFARSES